MPNLSARQHWTRAALVFLTLAATLVPGTVGAVGANGKPRPVRTMTRNLYLGADLVPAISAQTPQELAVAASLVWLDAQDTDFPERAEMLAAEIHDAEPVLIGLQEVSLWRTGIPDGPPSLGGSPAETVEIDFLQVLCDALQARGLHYEVVVMQEDADLEAPTILGFDVRLTQRDVILADSSLPSDELILGNAQSANFSNNLTLPLAGGLASVTVTRGWTSVDATVNRRSLRFVNTHLEAFSNFYRTAQTMELLSGPLATALPVVLVGDFNSDPDDPVFGEPGSPFNATNPYDVLISNGFVDSWLPANPGNPGFTCCNAADLLNPVPTLVRRVDHVLTSPTVGVYRSRLVGTDADNRTSSGLWPSDHAGVVSVVAP